jgi:L-aminopeptidase/D-esterase-like protein
MEEDVSRRWLVEVGFEVPIEVVELTLRQTRSGDLVLAKPTMIEVLLQEEWWVWTALWADQSLLEVVFEVPAEVVEEALREALLSDAARAELALIEALLEQAEQA